MKKYPVQFYKTFLRQWRWRVKADNGKIIGASSESFKNKIDCVHNAEILGFSLTQK